MARDPGDRLLRAKYLDWCSAQIAERFLELTPEEIYALAHEGTEGSVSVNEPVSGSPAVPPILGEPVEEADGSGSASPSGVPARVRDGGGEAAVEVSGAGAGPEAAKLSYAALVRRVTEVLVERMDLPAYEGWVSAYRAEPERYDEELLGFWKEWR